METSAQHDARCLIERINREHTLDGAVIGTRFEMLVSNCLEILSNQLYEKSTHFLLELIQNADDNTYNCPNPTLSFSYKPGSLRIDCNEVGFTAENVEAICAISRSTKSGKTSYGEYIGEKGIGFKSVFKAADVVWISSREFTFKFDKTKFLGMVAPIWAKFPETTWPGCTSIYLQLSKDYEEDTLIHELLTFDTNLLIFLRRIEEINIRVTRRDERVWENNIRKTESQQGADRVTVLHARENTFPYLIRSHVIKDLPKEHKRPNWPQTKILLAFPIAEFPKQPRLISQNVYAFLPIRNYGLKFLLQGDFLLTASREDIESTLPWNRIIRDALAEAFLLSIDHFNEGQLKYVWPCYLPSASTAESSFLEPAITSILAQLKESDVLESCAGTMVKASSLKHVPLDLFADGEGIPFTLSPHTAANYLSLKYPAWAIEATSSIGVSQLSPRGFLGDLNTIITQDSTNFRTRSATWHSELAETLVKLATDAELLSTIQDIRLIPLHDGNWTSARGQSMFFSKSETSLGIPGGIEVLIVDSTAESDSNRRKLFTSLGVKAWETPEICRLVLKIHESSNFDPKRLAVDQLISHAAFLYKASWQPPKTADLWFATMQDERCLGRKLYIPGSIGTNSAAARIFTQLQKRFAVIHDDYLKAFPLDADWPIWLVSNLGLSMAPRLTTPHVDPKPQPTQTLANYHNADVAVTGNDALQGYQMQLVLLEQQNKKRLQMMARDSIPIYDSPTTPPHLRPDSSPTKSSPRWDLQRLQEDNVEGEGRVETAGDANSKETPANITPLAPVGDTKIIFVLSEEFTFMLHECHTSDVLQLLRDNWHHYSQWIDGAHMEWQNTDFLESSTRLRESLGACLVQSARGSLPLRETVLPMIDPQLDEGRLIPTVDIKDPQHPEWAMLSYFGVIMKGDIHYYLRCLVAISEEQYPDVDHIAYIYEQIQARYKGNEELISAAFRGRDIILVHSESRRSTKPTGWTNIKECISRDIAIESEYPSSAYLFRCLISPIGDPIARIVATATVITSSSKLEDISRLFHDISAALKGVNTSKAAQLLRPLQKQSIFPITNGLGKRGYDNLLDIHNRSWFIADRPRIRKSFHGKLPLLALPIKDLSVLEDLFRVLRLDDRVLSKLATSRTQPKGRVTTHWAYTASLRAKGPFIKALIPNSHHNRTTIYRQIDNVRVSVARDISQAYTLNLAGSEVHGSPVRGQVSLSLTGNLLHLLMTEECAAGKCPPYELVSLLAGVCDIKDPNHLSLLYTALSSSSLQSIFSTFTQQGIYIEGLVLDKSKDRYRAQQGDLMRIPSPFLGRLNIMGGYFRGLPEAMRIGCFQRGGKFRDRDGDRRLPMMSFVRADGSVFEDAQSRSLVYASDEIDGWDHVQYLGEHMISRVLQAYLGQAYDPERDWTSGLRSRSGHKPFEGSTPCAAFTMRDPEILDKMTTFVIEYGHSQAPNWKENLRAHPPVYHLDLAVSAGCKTSSFVITSSQVERMRQFRMQDSANEYNTNIVVLVRVSNVYSENLLSIGLFVDPWRLFDSNGLTFDENWIFKGAIHENSSGSTRKGRKPSIPSLAWAMPASPGMHQNSLTTLRGHRNRETYTHRSLDLGNIRLLYLLPGETGDQLQGVIIHVPYESAETYRALSYVWGTDQRTQELTTPDGVLGITSSLNKSLRCLRDKNKAVMLWVDAICINQKDSKEKAQQIRLLPKIFQTAASTYAFLEGGKGSDAAIEMLMQVRAKAAYDEKSKLETDAIDGTESELGNDSECETNSGESTEADDGTSSKDGSDSEDWPEDLPRVPASWNGRCIPHLDDAIWTSVGELFSLSWFRRVWIIQEVVAAPNVKIVCGKWVIDWNDLHFAVEIIDREVQLSDDGSSHLRSRWEPFLSLAAQREWEARRYRWSLIMLLENFRYAESTLSRDRFFALLGLASDGNEAAFEPDYSSPLEVVVLKFARVFVRQGRGIQLLYRAGLSHHSHRFPSWIPDWTVRRPSSLHDSSESSVSFTASGPQQAKIKCIPDTDELIVEGYAVDAIDSISASSNVEREWQNYFKEVDAMVDSAVLNQVRDSHEDLKWKVPIAGVLHPKVAVSEAIDLQSSYRALRSYICRNQKGKAIEENRSSVNGTAQSTVYATAIEQIATNFLQKQSMSYIAALQDTVYGWKFVITKRGYAGVVPNMTQIGDVVAIMKGGRVPFILQKSMERPGSFRLVGECYIHCMMNGEGLSLPGVVETDFRNLAALSYIMKMLRDKKDITSSE